MSLSRFNWTPIQNQRFSLPEIIVHYLAKNPTSSKLWKKLIQTCKYFYSKNPIIVADCVCKTVNIDNTSSWVMELDEMETNIDLQHSSYKLWITDYLDAEFDDTPDRISSLIPRVYRFDLETLSLYKVSVTFDEFNCLTSSKSLIRFNFDDVILKHADGSLVDFVQILERMPRIQNFR